MAPFTPCVHCIVASFWERARSPGPGRAVYSSRMRRCEASHPFSTVSDGPGKRSSGLAKVPGVSVRMPPIVGLNWLSTMRSFRVC